MDLPPTKGRKKNLLLTFNKQRLSVMPTKNNDNARSANEVIARISALSLDLAKQF